MNPIGKGSRFLLAVAAAAAFGAPCAPAQEWAKPVKDSGAKAN